MADDNENNDNEGEQPRHRGKLWKRILNHYPPVVAAKLGYRGGKLIYKGGGSLLRFLTAGHRFGEHNPAANSHRGIELPPWAVHMSERTAKKGGYVIDPTGKNPNSWFQDQDGAWHFAGGPSYWNQNTPTNNVVEFMDRDHGDRGLISPPGGWNHTGPPDTPPDPGLPHDIAPPVEYDPTQYDPVYDPTARDGETPGAIFDPIGGRNVTFGTGDDNPPPSENNIPENFAHYLPSGPENIPPNEGMTPAYVSPDLVNPPPDENMTPGYVSPDFVNPAPNEGMLPPSDWGNPSNPPPDENMTPGYVSPDFLNPPPDENMTPGNVSPDFTNPAPNEDSPFAIDTYTEPPPGNDQPPEFIDDPSFQPPSDAAPNVSENDFPSGMPDLNIPNGGDAAPLDFSPDGVARTFPLPGATFQLGASGGNLGNFGSILANEELNHVLKFGILPEDAFGARRGTWTPKLADYWRDIFANRGFVYYPNNSTDETGHIPGGGGQGSTPPTKKV